MSPIEKAIVAYMRYFILPILIMFMTLGIMVGSILILSYFTNDISIHPTIMIILLLLTAIISIGLPHSKLFDQFFIKRK